MCKVTIGDIYLSILNFYKEGLARKETALSENVTKNTTELFSHQSNVPSSESNYATAIIPAPQEYSLFRLPRKVTLPRGDVFDAIGEEMASIQKTEEAAQNAVVSESLHSDSDSSFLGQSNKMKNESKASLVKGNERLYGSISLSFFPVPW